MNFRSTTKVRLERRLKMMMTHNKCWQILKLRVGKPWSSFSLNWIVLAQFHSIQLDQLFTGHKPCKSLPTMETLLECRFTQLQSLQNATQSSLWWGREKDRQIGDYPWNEYLSDAEVVDDLCKEQHLGTVGFPDWCKCARCTARTIPLLDFFLAVLTSLHSRYICSILIVFIHYIGSLASCSTPSVCLTSSLRPNNILSICLSSLSSISHVAYFIRNHQ